MAEAALEERVATLEQLVAQLMRTSGEETKRLVSDAERFVARLDSYLRQVGMA